MSPPPYFFLFDIPAGDVPAGWMPAFCVTASFVPSSIQAATCSNGNNSLIIESLRVFNISKPALSRSPIQLFS